MRLLASVLLLGCALAAGAAEIWRWTDADGVVHYSDNPAPGAVRVDTGPAPRPSGDGPAPALPAGPASVSRSERPPRAAFAYTRCGVNAPQADETFHGVQPVNIVLQVEPALQRDHRVEVRVDGVPVTDWPPESLTYTLPEVFRGSHTVQMRVLDAGGVVLCTGEPRTFHLRQASVLRPGGAAPQPNPGRGGY